MLAIDRQRRILDLLNGAGSLRTTDTATRLGVTDETVRKDFEVLENRGELLRIHGGASRPERIKEEQPFNERQAVRREEKLAIARLAASRIEANETIFLDASSTVLTRTEFLPDVPLSLLTEASSRNVLCWSRKTMTMAPSLLRNQLGSSSRLVRLSVVGRCGMSPATQSEVPRGSSV